MLLAEPPPTQGDIHFRLFGFPVRVSPFFWLTAVFFGIGSGDRGVAPGELLMWIAVMFGSILIHELGHAFVQRRFGGHPWIVLHGIGGLAVCDDCDRSPRSQILISLAGPAAGFAVAALIVAAIKLSGHPIGVTLSDEIPFEQLGIRAAYGFSILGAMLYWAPFPSPTANELLHNILFVNVLWGLVNLLPVYPLDGGRVSRELCTLGNVRRGIVLSLQISIATAGAMAVFGAVRWQSLYVALMFGYLAYLSFQMLQAYRRDYW
jgi:stage IV sporulation protein FB